MKTNKDITGSWFGHEEMTIPKGTRVTNLGCGEPLASGHYFIDDLSWVPRHEDGLKRYGFLHDAAYYGIPVTEEDVQS